MEFRLTILYQQYSMSRIWCRKLLWKLLKHSNEKVLLQLLQQIVITTTAHCWFHLHFRNPDLVKKSSSKNSSNSKVCLKASSLSCQTQTHNFQNQKVARNINWLKSNLLILIIHYKNRLKQHKISTMTHWMRIHRFNNQIVVLGKIYRSTNLHQ